MEMLNFKFGKFTVDQKEFDKTLSWIFFIIKSDFVKFSYF
jgi:hypothetical protein